MPASFLTARKSLIAANASEPPLIAANNRAVDDHVHGAEGLAVESRHHAMLGEILDLAEVGLAHVLAGCERLGAPRRQEHVPHRAVAALLRVPEENVERIAVAVQGGIDALALGIRRPDLAVHERRQAGAR